MTTDHPEFSVCVFFPDGSYEYICRFVSALEAIKVFKQQTETVGAKMGTSVRVILTDGGDCINMEWKHGIGFTFPPDLVKYNGATQ